MLRHGHSCCALVVRKVLHGHRCDGYGTADVLAEHAGRRGDFCNVTQHARQESDLLPCRHVVGEGCLTVRTTGVIVVRRRFEQFTCPCFECCEVDRPPQVARVRL